jgi:dTDP-4-dehydrorhamnose reductase
VRWLVTGSAGQLGHQLVSQLTASDVDVVGLSRAELDITDAEAVDQTLRRHRPDVLINAAAYTAVDAAEADEATALSVNEVGPGLLAGVIAGWGGRMIHISTDYVFSGDAAIPYEPYDTVGPKTAYGRTKLAGEGAVRSAGGYIVRTAWVYGGPGPNFVDTMRHLAARQPSVNVVADQTGSPTWAADLARGLIELGSADLAPGVLHYANTGRATWFELAQAVFAGIGADPGRVKPVTSAEFVRPAPRPAWSVLSPASWIGSGLSSPRSWQDALAEYLSETDQADQPQL